MTSFFIAIIVIFCLTIKPHIILATNNNDAFELVCPGETEYPRYPDGRPCDCDSDCRENDNIFIANCCASTGPTVPPVAAPSTNKPTNLPTEVITTQFTCPAGEEEEEGQSSIVVDCVCNYNDCQDGGEEELIGIIDDGNCCTIEKCCNNNNDDNNESSSSSPSSSSSSLEEEDQQPLIMMESLTTEEFYDGVQSGRFDVIIDVRSMGEWEADGHIEGATHLEDLNLFGTSREVATPADLAGCEECTIVVYCFSGIRARKAIQILIDAGGFSNFPIYNGLGIRQWRDAGYPLVDDTTSPSVVAPCQLGLSCSGSTAAEEEEDDDDSTPFLGNICFSSKDTVDVLGKGIISMKDLRVNDYVKINSDDNKYERVYTFGHRDEYVSATKYLQFLPSRLEISYDHMVYVKNKNTFVPASMVVIGDIFEAENNNGNKQDIVVKDIREVTNKRIGAYAPFTTSGTILVNGVVASNYIAFQNSSTVVVFGSFDTGISYQWVAHTFLTPYRLWSNYVFHFYYGDNDDNFSKSEMSRSNNDNDDEYIVLGYNMYVWLLNQNPIVFSIILIPIMGMLAIFQGIETLLLLTLKSYDWTIYNKNILLIPFIVIGSIIITASRSKKNICF